MYEVDGQVYYMYEVDGQVYYMYRVTVGPIAKG
jgi:hypothetical protein